MARKAETYVMTKMAGNWRIFFCFCGYTAFAVLWSGLMSTDAEPQYIGWSILAAIAVLTTSIVPIVRWYHRLEVTASMIIMEIISEAILCFYALLMFLIEFHGEANVKSLVILFVVVGYPMLLCLAIAILKWREDRWILSRSIVVLFVAALCLFIAFDVIVFLYASYAAGVVLLSIFIVAASAVLIVCRWQQGKYYLPPAYRFFIGALLTLLIVSGIAVGFLTEYAFVGFSITLFSILLGTAGYAMQKLMSRSGNSLTFGKFVLPVEKRAPPPIHVKRSSRGTWFAFVSLFLLLLWGIAATLFMAPVFVGMGISSLCVFLVALMIGQCLHLDAIRLLDCRSYITAEVVSNAHQAAIDVTYHSFKAASADTEAGKSIALPETETPKARVADYASQHRQMWEVPSIAIRLEAAASTMEANNRLREAFLTHSHYRALFRMLIFDTAASLRRKQASEFDEFVGDRCKTLKKSIEEQKKIWDGAATPEEKTKCEEKMSADADRLELYSSICYQKLEKGTPSQEESIILTEFQEFKRLGEEKKRIDEQKKLEDEEAARRRFEERKHHADAPALPPPAPPPAPAPVKTPAEKGGEPSRVAEPPVPHRPKREIDRIIEECEKSHTPFTDSTFPADESSLGGTMAAEWSRATQFLSSPEVFHEDDGKVAGLEDRVRQGALGDCWFISAISVLGKVAQRLEGLFNLPEKGGWKACIEHGVYSVRFFDNGVWREIVVDDYFPCRPDPSAPDKLAPAFASSSLENELFVMIIEKAYAKWHGAYDRLIGGLVHLGLVDLTGGASEECKVQADPAQVAMLWPRMLMANESGYLMGAGSTSGSNAEVTEFGIVKGHAYSILDVVMVDDVKLVKLRNPWGDAEWTGDYSDNSPLWTPRLKAKTNFVAREDGTFFMTFEDFTSNFRTLYICRLFPPEEKTSLSAEWKGITAGGSPQNPTYGNNPQFKLTILRPSVVFFVLKQVTPIGSEMVYIGMAAFNEEGKRCVRATKQRLLAITPSKSLREMSLEIELQPNVYTIVPAAFDPGVEREFVLDVYAKNLRDVLTIEKFPDAVATATEGAPSV